MRAISRALNIERLNEREYRTELASIRREIEFLLDFIDESPSHRSQTAMVEDLMETEWRIELALQRPTLPPIPYELRNPFTRPRTPAEAEYIRQLVRKHNGKRDKSVQMG